MLALSDQDARVSGNAVSRPRIPAYAWLVFALTFGLLISDFMARQVLNAVFPLLKAEWSLSDGQLGLLSGIVALMVGLLTCPISLLADRVGRVKSIAAMAVLWSIATALCGLARNYEQMLAARVLVGVGEAAYGSVGIAVILSVFPKHLRATLTGAFMAGGLAGQVLGVAVGGAVAAAHGWRMAFLAIGIGGLVLAIAYPWLVRESRLSNERDREHDQVARPSFRALFAGRRLKCAYVGSGLQLFIAGALPAWLPTYFVRYYDLPLKDAASRAGLFLAVGGVGMVICGMISDRVVQRHGPPRHAQCNLLRRLRTPALGCPLVRPRRSPTTIARCSNVPCCGHGRARWGDGREPDSRGAPRNGLCHPLPREQCHRPGARTDRHGVAGRPDRPAWCASVVAARQHVRGRSLSYRRPRLRT